MKINDEITENFQKILPYFVMATSPILIILSDTLAAAFFISKFSVENLSFLYLGQAFINIPFLYLSSFLHDRKRLFFIIEIILMLFVFSMPWIAKCDNYLIAATVPFGLMATAHLYSLVNWEAVHSSYNPNQFKRSSASLIFVSTLCASLMLFILPTIKGVLNLDVLIYLFLISMVFGKCIRYYLPHIKQLTRRIKHEKSLLDFSLCKQFIFIALTAYIINVITDFSFKYELGLNYSDKDILKYIIYFSSISALLSLLSSFISHWVVKQVGFFVLFYALPIYYLIFSIVFYLYPGIWTAALLAAGHPIFYYSSYSIAREILINPLPLWARTKLRFLLKTFVGSLGTLLGFVIVYGVGHVFSLGVISLFTVIFSCIFFIILWKIPKSYYSVLKDSIYLKRFDINDIKNAESRNNYRDICLNSLKSEDPEVVRYSIFLLQNFKINVFDSGVITLLDSPYPEIRIQVIKLLKDKKDKKIIPRLRDRLLLEEDPRIISELIHALCELGDEKEIQHVQKYLDSDISIVKGAALRLTLLFGNPHQMQEAINEMIKMYERGSDDDYIEIAKLIGEVPSGILTNELNELIKNKNLKVSIEAVKSIAQVQSHDSLQLLIDNLNRTKLSSYIVKALTQSKGKINPFLEKSYTNSPQKTAQQLARIIVRRGEIGYENLLERILSHENYYIANLIAHECAKRSLFEPFSLHFKKPVFEYIERDAEYIGKLRTFMMSVSDNFFRKEIASRVEALKLRVIHWIAVVSTSPKSVFEIIPFITKNDSMLTKDSSHYERALEVLSSYLPNIRLSSLVTHSFAPHLKDSIEDDDVHKILSEDLWLGQVARYSGSVYSQSIEKENFSMIDMEKVAILRKTKLFHRLEPEIIIEMASQVEKQEMYKGDYIFEKGAKGDGLYIVSSGSVEIRIGTDVINTINPGGYFGELSLIDDSPRTASAIAKEDGLVLFIDKVTFEDITYCFPELLWELLRTVTIYLRDDHESIKEK